MSKRGSSRGYVPQDEKYWEAKKRGFVARSALKLEEVDAKSKLFSKGQRVLDLGAAPGSWAQYILDRIGTTGELVCVDVALIKIVAPNLSFHQLDLFSLLEVDSPLQGVKPFDVVVSDAMVKTMGVADADALRSVSLVEAMLAYCRQGYLKPEGPFLAKVFEGDGFQELLKELKASFSKVKILRPEAVRKGSREVYVLCQGFKGGFKAGPSKS